MKSNKDTLKALMAELSLTQTRCAVVISEITLRPLSARAVRAWLTDPSNPSARNCPDWAINALVEYQKRPMVFEDEDSSGELPTVSEQHKHDSAPVKNAKPSQAFPYSIEELEAAFTAAFKEGKKAKEDKKRSKLEQILYRCPQCRLRVFGKADLWVVCGECRCAMEEND